MCVCVKYMSHYTQINCRLLFLKYYVSQALSECFGKGRQIVIPHFSEEVTRMEEMVKGETDF